MAGGSSLLGKAYRTLKKPFVHPIKNITLSTFQWLPHVRSL